MGNLSFKLLRNPVALALNLLNCIARFGVWGVCFACLWKA